MNERATVAHDRMKPETIESRQTEVAQRRTALLYLPALLLGAFVSGCEEQDYWSTTTFSPEQWRQTRETERYRFVNDLVRSKILIGKSRNAVLDLLGPSSGYESRPNELTYVVKSGASTFLSFNQVFVLKIGLYGSSGEVTAVAIMGD
jgi:hypothetical protein